MTRLQLERISVLFYQRKSDRDKCLYLNHGGTWKGQLLKPLICFLFKNSTVNNGETGLYENGFYRYLLDGFDDCDFSLVPILFEWGSNILSTQLGCGKWSTLQVSFEKFTVLYFNFWSTVFMYLLLHRSQWRLSNQDGSFNSVNNLSFGHDTTYQDASCASTTNPANFLCHLEEGISVIASDIWTLYTCTQYHSYVRTTVFFICCHSSCTGRIQITESQETRIQNEA